LQGNDVFRKECVEIASSITPEVHHKANKIFENDSPVALIRGLEAFVGLLRDAPFANNVDVELYLKHHDKLQLKLANINPSTLSLKNVRAHKANLQTMSDAFTNSSHEDYDVCSPFSGFIAWGQNFANLAEKVLEADQIQTKIAAHEETLASQKLALDRLEKVLADITEENLDAYYKDSHASLNTRIAMIEDMADQDYNQSVKYQEDYHKFDKTYFANFLNIMSEYKKESRMSLEGNEKRQSLFQQF